MSKLVQLLSYLLVAAAAVIVTAISTAGAHPSSVPVHSTIHINNTDVHEAFSITGKKHPNLGDHGVFNGLLTSGAQKVGRSLGRCDFVSQSQLQCDIQLDLKNRGRIVVMGTVETCQVCGTKSGPPNYMAVVGGTGEFSAARGWLVDHPYANGSKDHLVINLR